jgi:hypothetical protein
MLTRRNVLLAGVLIITLAEIRTALLAHSDGYASRRTDVTSARLFTDEEGATSRVRGNRK